MKRLIGGLGIGESGLGAGGGLNGGRGKEDADEACWMPA